MDGHEARQPLNPNMYAAAPLSQPRPKKPRRLTVFEGIDTDFSSDSHPGNLASLDSLFAPRKRQRAALASASNAASSLSSSGASPSLSLELSGFQMPRLETLFGVPSADSQAASFYPGSLPKPVSPLKDDSVWPRNADPEKPKPGSVSVFDPAASSTASHSLRSSSSYFSKMGLATLNSNNPSEYQFAAPQPSATDLATPFLDAQSPGNVAMESDVANLLCRLTRMPPAESAISTLSNNATRTSPVSGKFVKLLKPLLEMSDPTLQLMALQELSEILSMATEDMFIGGGSSLMYGFNMEEFIKALLSILKCSSSTSSTEFGLPSELLEEMGIFNRGDGFVNSEILLLAGRCLSNLLEANPSSSGQIVRHGGVQVLVSKLTEIQFIDLAEQMLQVLEILSIDYPGAIFRANGLIAVLQFIDFFNLHVQRTCITIAANLCRGLNGFIRERLRNSENDIIHHQAFGMVKEAMGFLEKLLRSGDPKILEQTVCSVFNIVEWISKSEDKLKILITSSLLRSIIEVIVPVPTKSLASSFVFTHLVKVLATASRGSADLGMLMLSDLGAIDVIRKVLTGGAIFPTDLDSTKTKVDEDEKISAAVMEVVINRPAEQLLEVLALACDLLPMLPKNHRVWSLNKQLKFLTIFETEKQSKTSCTLLDKDGDVEMGEPAFRNKGKEPEFVPPNPASIFPIPPIRDPNFYSKRAMQKQNEERIRETCRLNLLKAKPTLISTYNTQLLPVLIEVFSASVNPQVQRKVVECVAKGVWFMIECHKDDPMQVDDGDETVKLRSEWLGRTLLETRGFGKLVSELISTQELAFAPVSTVTLQSATTAAAITDRRDALLLVASGLQIAKIVYDNCGDIFKIWFLREGVVAEMENIIKSVEISDNEKKLAVRLLKTDDTGNDNVVKNLGDSTDEWKKLKQQMNTTDVKYEAPEVVEIRNKLKVLADNAQELFNKVKSTSTLFDKQTVNENASSSVQKKTNLQIDTRATENSLEEKKPTFPFITGFKNVLNTYEKPELSQNESTSLKITSSASTTSQSLSTLNGEKMSERDIRKLCVALCRIIIGDAKANLDGLVKRDTVSELILDDLKKRSIELQTDKCQLTESYVLKPSEIQALSNAESKSCDIILNTLQKVAIHFSGSETQVKRRLSVFEKGTMKESQSDLFSGVTVYELMESGIIDSLISFLTIPATSDHFDPSTAPTAIFQIPLQTRLHSFIHVFMNGPTTHTHHQNFYVHNAMRMLVQRLQQTLSRIERFQVATVSPTPTASDSGMYSLPLMSSIAAREHANPALQLTKQIRIRLVAEATGINVDSKNAILVSIHAVATFKALQEYLRTRLTEVEDDEDLELETEEIAIESSEFATINTEDAGANPDYVDEAIMDDFNEDDEDEDIEDDEVK
ncbi:Ubiquitin fusion degradation protein 4 [Nowakowskiella sp. JEL0078]|nr:Ubiquitin fusion degradation protein 4 [Nowakowskiella sp. JEL0078]